MKDIEFFFVQSIYVKILFMYKECEYDLFKYIKKYNERQKERKEKKRN